MRIVWAIIGGVAGFVVGGAVLDILAYLAIGAPSLSDVEGQRAAASAFAFGPLGALLGLGVGIWLALRLTRRAH